MIEFFSALLEERHGQDMTWIKQPEFLVSFFCKFINVWECFEKLTLTNFYEGGEKNA